MNINIRLNTINIGQDNYYFILEKEGYEDLIVKAMLPISGFIKIAFGKDDIERIINHPKILEVYGGNKITE